MRQFGLIGQSLAHSWSPRWFAAYFERQGITDACYRLYEVAEVAHLRELVADKQLRGFNVTIPYKQAVLPLLDSLDEAARAIGAVNCVTVEGSRLTGHNTDAPAFLDTLRPLLRPCHTAALVLGTGGAAKAVKYALESIGIDVQLVSRTPEDHPGSISYATAVAESARRLLIVNATPVGMFPHTDASPWPTNSVPTPYQLRFDLVYNPEETLFLREGRLHGAAVCNGLAMLHRQAELSWTLWDPA